MDKLSRILDQALANNTKERRQQLSFIYKAKTYRIFSRDIQYIESRNRIICFHLANKTILQCYAKLDDIIKQLPEESIIRCHKSFAVNIYNVTEMTNTHFRIDNDVIRISKKYAKEATDKNFAFYFLPFE